MSKQRVSLYERLPEIYRTKDQEQPLPDQLKSYLALVESAFSAIHENIEALYNDLFIETSDDWVIPYIGDLLGTSHLSGDPWTTRADVADTIALRRRKGTLHAIELLTYNLTKWGVRCVELRENMVWNQHLNHQRPDEGGLPPYRAANPNVKRQTLVRGGTVTLRDPAMLALLDTPFDLFAHTADLKPPAASSIRYNLPNLAIFLWRLSAYRVSLTRPLKKHESIIHVGADFIVRFNINPIARPYVVAKPSEGQPVRLFNSNRFDLFVRHRKGVGSLNLGQIDPRITRPDETPGPIPTERLSEGEPAGAPSEYLSVNTYTAINSNYIVNLSDVGLQLHLPQSDFPNQSWPKVGPPSWKIRGENLCAWETSINPPLKAGEIAIDPVIGRLVIAVETEAKAKALESGLLVTYTYGSAGPVGAHPIPRPALPEKLNIAPNDPNFHHVNYHADPNGLFKALNAAPVGDGPIVIEIDDSMTHKLDISALDAARRITKNGITSLKLNNPLVIRAADNQRPIIELAQPLRFRPANVASPSGPNSADQKKFNAAMAELNVRLEALFITRGETFAPLNQGLIERAALNRLEIIDCTLDPGGFRRFAGTHPPILPRAPILPSLKLEESYGFTEDPNEGIAFNQIPEIVLSRSIAGPLLIDAEYYLSLTDSIIDAGQGVDDHVDALTIAAATTGRIWGPPTQVSGVTFFGRTRVESINGRGGIWVHALEVQDNQKGCLKFSYFSGESADRLPQNHGCVKGTNALLRFTSEIFGEPAYAQLAATTDMRIREQGPNDDAMGAFGFLLEAHKWRNLQIRYREFMPVGIRPLLIPFT